MAREIWPAAWCYSYLRGHWGLTVKKSKHWALFCMIQLYHYIALTTRNSSSLFYAKYRLGETIDHSEYTVGTKGR